MYHASVAGTTGTLAFTGAALDSGWMIVLAVATLFAGLALQKIAPKRKKADR